MGYFGQSLVPAYDYEGHPRYDVFASGLMAYDHTPAGMRDDPELRAEFQPKELAGLCDGYLYWRSEEKIAEDRDLLARAAEYRAGHEAERAAGRY